MSTFSIQIMFSLIPSGAYDPQGLMRRQAPNNWKWTRLFDEIRLFLLEINPFQLSVLFIGQRQTV